MKILIVLVAAASIFATIAGATILIDLPDLAGTYAIGDNPPPDSPWTRTMTFTLPDSIESIEGLRFVASGPWEAGRRETCRDVQGVVYCDTLAYLARLTLRLSAEQLGACHFEAMALAYVWLNANEVMFEVCAEGQSDVNLLLGSVITAELFCDVSAAVVPYIFEAANGTVDWVRLETVGAVEIRQSTWGAVKAAYR